jgi:hypothetical protein
MAETEHDRFMREQREATERANAQRERIEAERGLAQAERDQITDRQGNREGGAGPND